MGEAGKSRLIGSLERSTATFTAYPLRWGILAVFGACSFTNAFAWIMYSPIEKEAKEFFGTTDTGVNFFRFAAQ